MCGGARAARRAERHFTSNRATVYRGAGPLFADQEPTRLLVRASERDVARCARGGGNSARRGGEGRRLVREPGDRVETQRQQRGWARRNPGMASAVREWVAFRESSRFRPSFWAPERRSGVLWSTPAVRLRSAEPGFPSERGRSAFHYR